MSNPNEKGQGGTELLERQKTQRPRRFKVLLHNDDYTTMDFVVLVLTKFFKQTASDATRLMLEVHRRGVATAGVYTRDVAETKVAQVTSFAEQNGHPLLVTAEPE